MQIIDASLYMWKNDIYGKQYIFRGNTNYD